MCPFCNVNYGRISAPFPMKKVPLFPILVTTNSPKKQQIIKQGKIQNGPVHAQNIYIYIQV